jgi:hypothetical protein
MLFRRWKWNADAPLTRVVCACRAGQEGTRNCNYGRLCGALSIGGRDVGGILISEGLAHLMSVARRAARSGARGVVVDRRGPVQQKTAGVAPGGSFVTPMQRG